MHKLFAPQLWKEEVMAKGNAKPAALESKAAGPPYPTVAFRLFRWLF
jgi:hypothetical protein